MHTTSRRTLGAAAIALTLIVGSAQFAGAQGKGKGHGKEKDNKHDAQAVVVDSRTGNVIGTVQNNGRRIPPGLARKGGLPPGQAKMYRPDDGVSAMRDVFGRRGYTVVRTVNSGESRYVYYRGADGSVRRAIVSPGTDRLSFSNVPQSLLTEILARLY